MLPPAFGLFLAVLLVPIVSWLFSRTTPFVVDTTFRWLQFVSASRCSLGHGGNDAQKTMGIIAVLLCSQGLPGGAFHVPLRVMLTCQAAMGFGTLFGGWRIVHAMGSKITRLTPTQGFVPRRAARSRRSWRQGSAYQSRPRTPSPAWAPRAGPRRSAAASPATSLSRGLLPCRRPV